MALASSSSSSFLRRFCRPSPSPSPPPSSSSSSSSSTSSPRTDELTSPSPASAPWLWQRKDLIAAAAAATGNRSMSRTRRSTGIGSQWTPASATATTTTTSIRGFATMRPYQSRFIHRHSRTLLYIMHLRDWDPSLERELSVSGAILTHNIVDQVMGCIPSPRLALQFFIWSGEQIGFPHPSSPSNYDILRWYARKSQTLVFLNILRSLGRPQLCLSPSKINVLIQGYGWAGMLDRSYKLLADCRGFGNAFLVNCFLYSVIKERRYDLVHDVYAEMKKCRLDPPMACIEKLVYGFSRAGGVRNWSEADELFDGIIRSGQVPSPELCNAFAVATSQLGKQNRALELFVYMKEHGIVPEKATFGALVECLCRCKQIQKASKLIEEMNQFGYNMDIKIYKTLLGAL